MRLVKMILFAALVVGWWQLWQARDQVVSAYTTERPPLALELNGVGVVSVGTEGSVSPYALHNAGPDRAPTFLPIAAPIEDPEDAASIPVLGGEVRLSGTVALVDGTPVAGATIWIERFTSDGRGVAETVSGSDGSWSAVGLRGGRIRIRAFAPNQLASVDPVVLVLSRTGRATVPLVVDTAVSGLRFEMAGPLGVAIGSTGTVAVVVSREAVDDVGRLVQLPVVGVETVGSIGGARLLSADVVSTDDGGAVRYLIACDAQTSPTVAISVDVDDALVALPPCMSADALAELEAAAAAERAAEQDMSQVGPGSTR